MRQVTRDDVLEFFYDANGAVGFYYNNTPYYYLKNIQGDVIGILDADGTQVVSYTYDAWGNPLSTTGTLADTIGQLNPFRYRSYYYDTETGLYYLNSRYYDAETSRFLNADKCIQTGQGLTSCNMFAYCQNNPTINVDHDGEFAIFGIAVSAATIAKLCMIAVAAVAAITIVSMPQTQQAISTAVSETITATSRSISKTKEKIKNGLPRNHTVYALVDSNGTTQYVGRTTNPTKRKAAHSLNPNRANLKFVPILTGLNAVEARGVEQIQMMHYHTINKKNKMNNQINGISPSNPKLGAYMEAGREALSYLDNKISNEILYWTGN